jgi:hypothetical protein
VQEIRIPGPKTMGEAQRPFLLHRLADPYQSFWVDLFVRCHSPAEHVLKTHLSKLGSATRLRVPHPSRFLRRVGTTNLKRNMPIVLQSSQVESCGAPPFAKSAKDPDFLLRDSVQGHVCGFL